MQIGSVLVHVRRVSEQVVADLTYATRLLRNAPGFTLTAVLSLALGIGASAALFSVADALLLRQLPAHAPHQLVEVSQEDAGLLSYPLFEAIRDRSQTLSGALAVAAGRLTASATLDGRATRDVQLSLVSGDYFTMLGVAPALGRALSEADLAGTDHVGAGISSEPGISSKPGTSSKPGIPDTAGNSGRPGSAGAIGAAGAGAGAAVIGHALWRDAFGADPAVIGRTLRLGGRPYTVVGVAPAGFTGIAAGAPVDVWVPLTWIDRRARQSSSAMMLRMLARRAPDRSPEEARAELAVLARQWSAELKLETPARLELSPASGGLTRLRRAFGRPLVIMMTIVGLLLLIAAANVANLLLARSSARQREIGLRVALGAARGRVIRQLLTESLLLGALGAALGLLLAPAATAFLVRFLASSEGSVTLPFTRDPRMLLFTLSTSLLVVLLFGLAPALAATRPDLVSMFKGAPRSGGSGARPARPRKLLMVAQVAMSCVLLVGAMLFARSLHRLATLDAGIRPEQVLLLQVDAASGGLNGETRSLAYAGVLDRLAQTPGVVSAALSSENLFSGNAWSENVTRTGETPRRGEMRDSILLVISPGFFRTLGTPLLRGRDFDPRDRLDTPPVAIVNEAMARRHFGDADPIGRTFVIENDEFPRPLTVVGLVHDAKYTSLRDAAPRMVYLPYRQRAAAPGTATFAVRTIARPDTMVDTAWQAARAENAALRFAGSTTQTRLMDATMAHDRMLAQLSGMFGMTALGLVGLGLYGLTAYDVARRTPEIGLRLALGAQRADVLRLVLGGSMTLVGLGVALGLGAALALARLVESLVFGVAAADTRTLLPPAAILVILGLAATWWPARRAARLDPTAALKWD